jgi:hypothetical protein
MVLDILRGGNEKARVEAEKTMTVLRDRLNFNF